MRGTCPFLNNVPGSPIMSPHYFQETHSGSCCWIRLLNSHLRITITDVTAGTFQICEPGTMSSRTLQINVVTFADVRLKLLTSSITIVLSHPQKFTCLPSRAHLFSAIAINWAKDRAVKARQGGSSARLTMCSTTTTPTSAYHQPLWA